MPLSHLHLKELQSLPADSLVKLTDRILPASKEVVWVVVDGVVVVSLQRVREDGEGEAINLAHLPRGAVVQQVHEIQGPVRIEYKVAEHTKVLGIKTATFVEFLERNGCLELRHKLFAEHVQYLSEDLHALFRADKGTPVSATNNLSSGEVLISGSRCVVRLEKGRLAYFGSEHNHSSSIFFLTPNTWIYCYEDAVVSRVENLTYEELQSAFSSFLHQATGIWTDLYFTPEGLSKRLQLMHDTKIVSDAYAIKSDLAGIMSKDRVGGTNQFPLQAALEIIGSQIGLDFIKPNTRVAASRTDPVNEWALASNIQYRKVSLEDGWYKDDSGIMLGFYRQFGDKDESDAPDYEHPVVLLPKINGNYTIVDPVSGRRFRVKKEESGSIHTQAYYFFKPFPQRKIVLPDLVKWILHGQKHTLLTVLACSVITGLLGLIPSVAMGYIFNQIIPFAMKSELYQFTILLAVVAFTTLTFNVISSFFIQRLEGLADLGLEAAVWDRILRQEPDFFHRFTTGDLVSRANGVNSVRAVITNSTVHSIFAVFLCIPSLFYLFWLNIKLALLALVLITFSTLLKLFFGYLSYHYQKKVPEYNGLLQDIVLQMIVSIEKIRTTFSAPARLKEWARIFSIKSSYAYKASFFSQISGVVSVVMPNVTMFAIYGLGLHWMDASAGSATLTTGVFVSFFSAFSVVSSSIGQMAGGVLQFLNAYPFWKRLEPIMNSVPEDYGTRTCIESLRGKIEISHLNFRYPGSEKIILDDISFTAEAGECVALVGKSGAGKSTLLRLMIGFEKIQTGAIFYDNHDLSEIDLGQLRRQFGVVLQQDGLMMADIFSNISGGNENCTLSKAWAAAEMAGIADDIKAMPMQMQTLVSNGGGTISGGQTQRIMLARALANDPQVLFLDEATNALDNKVQNSFTKNLDKLGMTRIIIAHRLSTIINADKILVLDNGNIVQEGRYQELADKDGLFSELIKRQQVNHC